MELYNDVLRELRALLPAEPTQRAAYNEALCAPAGEKDRILFGADTAYELGGGGKPGAQFLGNHTDGLPLLLQGNHLVAGLLPICGVL